MDYNIKKIPYFQREIFRSGHRSYFLWAMLLCLSLLSPQSFAIEEPSRPTKKGLVAQKQQAITPPLVKRLAAPSRISDPAILQRALSFELAADWVTAPLADLATVPESEYSRRSSQVSSLVAEVSNQRLASGAQQVKSNVTLGSYALRWDNHPRWPTLACTVIPADWSHSQSVGIDIFSEAATGEIVCLAFLADSPLTAHRDWWYFPLTINWKGARSVQLPLAAFQQLGSPKGWNDISGIVFFTKMLGCEPDPQTALTLDNLRPLESLAPESNWRDLLPTRMAFRDENGYLACEEKDKDRFIFRSIDPEWQRGALNHESPESSGNLPESVPFAYQNYFATERAIFGYYPRFIPGYVNFDSAGKAYIFCGDVVQRKKPDGSWEVIDLKPVLSTWAKKQGWAGLALMWDITSGDKSVRFDNSGCAYILAQVNRLDDTGKWVSYHNQETVLLYSRDGLHTWTCHALGSNTATMEQADLNNSECLERPPAIILSGIGATNQGTSLLLPEKASDGSLLLPAPVRIHHQSIYIPIHSGGANFLVTRDHKIFIVFPWCSRSNSASSDPQLPPIPKNHLGQLQSFVRTNGSAPVLSSSGTPTFVVMYDLKSRQLSNPVYIMSGGRSIDNHNWPAITIDSAGYLHVLASGHQDPLNYAHSEKPLNIEEWTAPEYIEDPRWPNTYLSYPTLNFDKNDNLYCVARNSSCRSHREPNVWSDFSAYEEKSLSGQYNNRLSLFIKTRTDKWKFKEDVIVPSSFGYKNWGHKMALNRQTGQMCLSYYSQSNLKFLWGDSYAWAIFIWPDSEIQYNRGKKVVGGLNGGDPFSQPASTYMGGMDIATELTSLIYNPEVGQWKLLSSSDLR